MAQAQVGSANLSKISTGRALFKISGDVDYHDLGSLSLHKYRDDQEEVPIMRASKGKRKVIGSRVTKIDRRYALTGDEETELAMRLQLGAAAPTTGTGVDQAASTTDLTQQVVGITQGRAIQLLNEDSLPAVDVTLNVVEVSSSAVTGYTFDADSGILIPNIGGDITDGVTLDLEYDVAAATRRMFTAGDDNQLSGHLIFHEEDQLSDLPRRTWQGNAQIRLINSGDQDGNKVATYEFEVLFTSDPTLIVRDAT